ncbi:NB-ARC domain-containing protein [Actinacidiphila yanglinensis]|uniref:NB-ARC domain-containing protein n=1 Tax=Actinacidiphila yanglinensis TaxID=310779 RepID=A0A1H5SV89_9ACTN|nr:tetratricopeptide repeat protein [Actinacidiphila yanglinensis]SEF54409.1 NB-ARC domain-containing protein [Actinacidiphila yanglinensis]
MVDVRVVEALLSAKVSHAVGRDPAAWQALTEAMGSLTGLDPELAAAWRDLRTEGVAGAVEAAGPAGAATAATLRARAARLTAVAARNGPSLDRLRRWALRYPAPEVRGDTVNNRLDGGAQVHGPVVQARDITGGIHVHHAPVAAAPKRPIPRQLLPASPYFTGRGLDLRALDELREERDPSAAQVIVVSGQAGVGKTALASRWLGARVAEFPDGQLYVNLGGGAPGGPAHPGDVLGYLLRAFGESIEPADLAERAALWRSVTATLRFAVMVDDALSAAEVRLLLPNAPGSLVLATSRQRLTGLAVDGAGFWPLGVLDTEAAEELFTRGTGRTRAAREPAAVREVVALCAGLPLAVRLASARLASRPDQPVASLRDALTGGAGPLGVLRAEGAGTVQAVLDASYGVLPPDAARLYRRLGLLPAVVFDTALAAAAAALRPDEAEGLIDVLVEASLLEPAGGGQFRFHALVRLHAAQRAESDETAPAREDTVRRHVDWCLATATSAEALLSPSHRTLERTYRFPAEPPPAFTGEDAALAWLEAHRDALIAAVRQAARARWHDTAWQLVDALWPMFLRLRMYDTWIASHEIGLAAARDSGNPAAQARMLTSGGIGLRSAGRHEEAVRWFSQALDLARQQGDLRDEAQALSGLGSSYRAAGHLELAEEMFLQALRLREAVGYHRGAALSRLRLGELALERDDFATASRRLARAQAELTAERDPYDAARARALFGYALAGAGRRDDGVRELRLALDEFDAAGSPFWRARTLEMLGRVAERDGDATAARQLYEDALRIFTGAGPVDARRVEGRLRGLRPEDAPP